MPPAVSNRAWFWAALALTGVKLWLTSGQTIYAIGAAIHDDKLFALQAAHILSGNWLGPYNQFTLAKGPFFPLFLAGVFWIGLPLILVQQLLYAGASAVVTRALAPWFRTAGAQFTLYTVLLLNPMSWDAGNLGRLMRQNIYTPLALLIIACLVHLFRRRREAWHRQAMPAAFAGLTLGCFWLTREESVWLLPTVGLLLFGTVAALGREVLARWRTLAVSFGVFLGAALLPILVICTLNYRHYDWFGTVEFRAKEFKDAYGALTRIKVGPDLPHQIPVTRQMREAAYELSPAFAQLRPFLEGPVGEHWVEKQLFPAEERQIRGGWLVWAIRDAMAAAGLAPDAGLAMDHYRLIASEINAACDNGRVPARPRRSGFVPPLSQRDVKPLMDGAIEYASFFIFFKGFTAQSPNSQGDYAELKPFRDIVGTRLSHAPRSPDPFPPTQGELETTKVSWLETLGLQIGRVLAWLGPLLLLTGLVRTVEAGLERQVTFLLGLAIALLSGCAAYLAINVLVHVTSFYNMSPAAMASAYPLYLVALAAIGIDAVRVWSRPTAAAPRPARASSLTSAWLLIPAGAAIVVFAARLHEVQLFASDVPYNDQWIIEAQQIIAPWLDGTLRPWTFFTPHFEHLPVWTRLICWLQVAVTGRWDPLVQMTLNAGFHAIFVFLATRWLWQNLGTRPAGFVTMVLILGGALPHAWENIAWGFQSQFPLALICLFIHVRGACTHPPGSRGWWLAQATGLAGLFTLASMWLAPLAVALSYLWTGRAERRSIAAPLVLSALGITLLAIIHWRSPEGYSFAQASRSPLDFLHSSLHLLSWPSGLPGALSILQMPWLVHALRLRRQGEVRSIDRIIFILGLWNCAQAAGLAFARTGDTGDYVSRYGDVFFVGTLSGALALTRLVPTLNRARTVFFAGAMLWSGLVVSGLFFRATEGHARYFHQTAAQANELRRSAVQAYVRDGDRSQLDKNETRWVLSQSTDIVVGLLDRTDFRSILTASMNPAVSDSALSLFNRGLQSRWPWLVVVGGVVFVVGLVVRHRRGDFASDIPYMADISDPWRGRIALGIGLACAFGLLVWSNPLVFNRETRWRQMLGGEQALTGLTFRFATPSPFGSERMQGAAPLSPVELRNQFFGTAPAGPTLTCTAHSSAFTLTKPWLVVPYAGYPVGEGNGLRVQILDDSGTSVVTELGCPGPNLDGIGYWPVDVSAYAGRKARLVLYDGRTDTHAWVAAAPPIPSDSSALATSLDQKLRREKHSGLHASMAVTALVSFTCFTVIWVGRRRHPLPQAQAV